MKMNEENRQEKSPNEGDIKKELRKIAWEHFCEVFEEAKEVSNNRPTTIRPRATDSARVIQVIETIALRGHGTKEDPCKEVRQHWDFDGNLLAEYEPSLKN